MALRRKPTKQYPETTSSYNQTGPNNPSHFTEEETSYNLKPITLENIDQCVWQEFHQRFFINNKQVNLIPLDGELAAWRYEFPENDTETQLLVFPYFLFWRTKVEPMTRTSPSNKPTIFVIPKQKPQGIVYEEWIAPVPNLLKLTYSFKFITSYREHLNELETYMVDYFKNKRNVLSLDGERFEIYPEQGQLGELNVQQREGSQGQTLYVVEYILFVTAYLRDINQIQKRERPSILDIKITEHSGSQLTSILQQVSRLPKDGDPGI